MILRRRRKRDSILPWTQLLVDFLTIYGVLFLIFWVRFVSGYFETPLGPENYSIYYNAFHFTALITIYFLRSNSLYRPGSFFTFSQEATKIVKSGISSTIFLMATSFLIRDFSFSRSFLFTADLFLILGLILARFVLGNAVMLIDKKRGSFRNLLIIGCDENAGRLARYYKNNPRLGRRVVGFIDFTSTNISSFEELPVVGKMPDLARALQRDRQIHEVILASQDCPQEEVLKMISDCEKEMVVFRRTADMFGLIMSRMSVSYAGGISLLSFTDSPLGDWENRVSKRIFDIVLSLCALVMLSPVFIFIGVLVKLTSKGPVFYRQERIGEDGRHFMLLKFRTMKTDAEQESGPVWAKENDPRRTPIGTFLRQNNLDELPQLWNVFVGEMSLVGPRPERPYFVSQFKEDIPRYMARHTIRSGITGWAQVNGLRGNTSIEERTKFDLYYIENWSLFFDFKILMMTVLARKNAY